MDEIYYKIKLKELCKGGSLNKLTVEQLKKELDTLEKQKKNVTTKQKGVW